MAHTKFGVNMPKHCRDIASIRPWCQYAKALQRYGLNTALVSICQSIAEIRSFWHHNSNSLLWYVKTVLSINTKSITFCQHGLKMI